MRSFSYLALLLFLAGCGSRMDNFPMNKTYWGPEEYDQAITEIRYRTPEGDSYPRISDPEFGAVFKKLIDKENVSVVLKDNSLGLKHRAKFSGNMFDEVRDLVQTYSVMDREDKFVYDRELVEVMKFSLYLQLDYFDLGNQEIIRDNDDSNSYSVQQTLRSNERTLVSNFNIYLDYVNKENSFSDEAIVSFAEGIDIYFKELVERFPKANFNPTRSKTTAMLKKAKNEILKASLEKLILTLPNPETMAVQK
jgi:hypothetical protein